MEYRELCAICQQKTEDILCEQCRQTWDADSKWVKDLVQQELYWRVVNQHERRLSPLHLTVDGCLHSDRRKVSSKYLRDQICQIVQRDDTWTVEEIELWAEMGGLTLGEQIVFLLMMEGANDEDGAAVLNHLENKQITASAYRRRMERLLSKLRDAAKAGVLSPENLGMIGVLPAIPASRFLGGFVRPGVLPLVLCACVMMIAFLVGDAPADYPALR